jgi:hypothetical protein
MRHFTFKIVKEDDIEFGELKVEDSTYCTMKWFFPRKTENGISFSDNNEPFQLKTFQSFISNIRNDINCIYYRYNEAILEYKDNTFRIVPDSSQTGLNFDSNEIEFYIKDHKEELLETLEEMYSWFTTII